MPALFENIGLQFQYPDNWTIEHQNALEEESGHQGQVVVSSPNTAFWQLTRYPADADLEPLFDEAMGALRTEYGSIEAEPDTETIGGRELNGYEINFFCLDLTVTSLLRGFKTDDASYFLLCQAEDRELATAVPVFQAMLASLFKNLDA